MSQNLSIRSRLLFLSLLLVASLIVTNSILIRQTRLQGQLIRQQAESIDMIVRADAAIKTFGDLKYWLTDLAVSQMVLSEQKAAAARARLDEQLSDLQRDVPDDVAGLSAQLAELTEDAKAAAKAYEENDRFVGNAMMAKGRGHILAVDSRLSTLVGQLRSTARGAAEAALDRAEQGITLAASTVFLVVAVAAGLTFFVVRSVVVPLQQMVVVIQEMSGGRMDAPIPPVGRNEIGEVARVLTLFRDSVVRRERAERTEARLREVIENTPEGFALYDAEDRLVLSNRRYREGLHPRSSSRGSEDLMVEGTSFETVVRASAGYGLIVDAGNDIDAWISRRLEHHRNPRGPFVQQRSDGRWFQIDEHKVEDGGTVAFYIEITELKKREAELAEKTAILEATLENMGEGISMFGPDLKLIVHNRKFFDLWDYSADRFAPGSSGEDFIRYNAERGEYGPGDIEALTRERLTFVTQREAHVYEHTRPNGTAIEVRRTPLPTGGFVSTYTDVSDRKRAEKAFRESEQRLNSIVDNMPATVFLRDVQGRYILINRQYEAHCQITREAVRGKTVYDVLSKDLAEESASHDREVLETGRAIERELIFPLPDGLHILAAVKFPITDTAGEIVAIGGVELDITELKRAETALRASEMKFRSLAQSASDAVIAADSDGRIISWNGAAEVIFGYGEDDAVGRDLTMLMPERYRAGHQEGFSRFLETGESRAIGRRLEFEGLREDGSEFPIELSIGTWRTEDEVYFGGILRDVSARKRAQIELFEAKEQAEVANQAKSQFLANMSHELRTPMNAILGYTELILDNVYGKVPDKLEEIIRRVDHNGRHLLGLIHNVLDLSKIEAGEFSLLLNDYAMSDVVESVILSLESLARDKNIDVAAKVAPDLPVGKGDEQRIAQVLMNLVANAIKFTDAGDVVVTTGVENGSFLVSVSDTGAGISEADQEMIFEEFHQADSSSTRKAGGTGLGLAICQSMVKMHGGKIWVDSKLGEGSTFYFTVPIRVEAQSEAT